MIRVRGHFREFVIRAWHEQPASDPASSCPTLQLAVVWMHELADDPSSMIAVREYASQMRCVSSIDRWTDHEILEQLAGHVSTGELVLTPDTRVPAPLPAGGAREREAESRPGTAPSPHAPGGDTRGETRAHAAPMPREHAAPPSVARHWIAFAVIDDETGLPAADVELRLRRPDGTVGTCTTDATGSVHLADLPAGTCDLEQILDTEAFEVVRFE